jgi:hypothetical protein
MSLTAELAEQLAIADRESDYVAVELLWNILVKAAHSQRRRTEFARVQLLIKGLGMAEATSLMNQPSVDTLLNIDPPLETVFVDPNEWRQTQQAAAELAIIRASRFADPAKAVETLICVLKRIRNKRVHGFKTLKGSRDTEILGAARPLLSALCHALI